MKVIAIIPARYQSSRFPGKPLADIAGKPMIWWVYQQVKKCKNIDDVYVATDDTRISEVCERENIAYVMTRSDHKSSTERAYEVSNKVSADLYVVVNGDEPLIDPALIDSIVPEEMPQEEIFVSNLMTEISSPAEVVDFTNIKVVVDADSNALFMSRSPIPYPKASIDYRYFKHVGVLIYNAAALEFFSETPKGENEKIEDVNELRFIEHGIKLKMIPVEAHSLSVDTPKDLEYVKEVVQQKIREGLIASPVKG